MVIPLDEELELVVEELLEEAVDDEVVLLDDTVDDEVVLAALDELVEAPLLAPVTGIALALLVPAPPTPLAPTEPIMPPTPPLDPTGPPLAAVVKLPLSSSASPPAAQAAAANSKATIPASPLDLVPNLAMVRNLSHRAYHRCCRTRCTFHACQRHPDPSVQQRWRKATWRPLATDAQMAELVLHGFWECAVAYWQGAEKLPSTAFVRSSPLAALCASGACSPTMSRLRGLLAARLASAAPDAAGSVPCSACWPTT